jgi:predicted  nucleic acid-binding Zn-ribbon protein
MLPLPMEEDLTKAFSDEELRNIKSQYNKAKDVLEKINSLSIRYDASFKAFETRNIDVEKVASDVREKAVSVENSKNESANFVAEIKGNLEKIQSSISQIEEAAIKFEGIKGRIEGKEGEMDALLSAAKGLKDDIEQAKTTAQQRLTDIDGQFVQAQEKIAQVQKAFEDFIAVQTKITNPNTGLQATLNLSTDLQRQSSETFAKIDSFHEQSKKYLEQIKTNKAETDKIKNDAQQNLKEIDLNKAEIEKITALITDTGLANAFQKREKMLRISAGLWLAILVFSVVGLALMLYFSFVGIQGVPELSVILYRLTLTSPLLFLIGIAIKQYGNERALNEKYAFKATIAAVIKSHSDFLIQVNGKAGVEDSSFMRDVLGGIYVEPYEKGVDLENIKDELKAITDKKDEVKKPSLIDVFNSVKELKQIVPDEVTLKSIIELLLKFK